MSYNAGWTTEPVFYSYDNNTWYGQSKTLMAFDIAAIQILYGINNAFQVGDNAYELPHINVAGTGWECIWDAGGMDTISNKNSNKDSTINLNDAPLVGNNAAGYVSWVNGISGGYIIANTVIIENAIGGSGNDLITGNTYDNNLQGGEGDDIVITGAGNDRIEGGAGNDTINLSANSTWGSGYAALNVSNNASVGTNQKIDLAGLNRFSDVIDGGADVDTLNLTDGNDAFFIEDIYSNLHPSFEDYFATALVVEGTPSSVARIVNLEVINAGEGNDIVDLTSSHYILANAIEINGEAGNDILWGSNGNDTINGGDGNDTINGGTGFDDLSGGTGTNIFQFTATSGSDDILDFDITQGSIQLYYRAGDDHTIADLSLSNGVLTWDVLIDNVVIDLSTTVTSSDLNDLDALISFVEIV